MAFSCEIQQPSRSNRTIRINGAAPYNEGSNDKFVTITDDQTITRLAINPTIHVNKKQAINKNNKSFEDLEKNDFKRVKEYVQTVSDGKAAHPLGFNKKALEEDTNTRKNDSFEDKSYSRSDYRPVDLVNFSELQLLQLSVSSSLNFEQIFNNLDIESTNGTIEPFVLRDLGSSQIPADFPVNTFKVDLNNKDVRNRTFLQSFFYGDSSLEPYEESVDSFVTLRPVTLKSYTTSQSGTEIKENYINIKYSTEAVDSSKSYAPRLLDMSWLSSDNSFIKPFSEKSKSIKEDIDAIDGLTLKSLDLLDHVSSKPIKIEKRFNKATTGHTIDYSKSLCGIDSIAFEGLIEWER